MSSPARSRSVNEMTEEASAFVDSVMNKLMALTIISDSNLYIDAENNLELQTHVYVNKHVNKQIMKELKCNTSWRNKNMDKIFNYKYEIDNKLFNIEETYTGGLYAECEIYATRKGVKDTNIVAIVDSPASSIATNNSHMSIKEVEDGYLVNSTIFISDHAWHTLVTFFDKSHPYFCGVCGFEDFIVDCNEHILLDEHTENMEFFEPIEEYNYIIRKIEDQYYCAVCNRCIDETSVELHLKSDFHNKNYDLALQKAFEIIQDESENITDSETNTSTTNEVNDKLCHCAHCNSLQYITDMESHIESKHPKKHDIQKHTNHENMKVKVTNAEHENRVKIETVDGASNKLHLDKKSNDNNTIGVEINESITENVRNIRRENGKQMIVTKKSTIATQNIGSSNKEIEVQRDNPFIHNDSQQSIDNDKYNQVNDYNLYDAKVFYVNGDLMIYFMGCKMRIDHWSYNFISKIQTGFFCKLCYVCFKDSYLLYHIHAETHMLALRITHYNPIYACHLIRLLKNVLHCTICNIEFDSLQVHLHIMSQMHVMLLNKSIVRNAIESEPTKCECNSITADDKFNTDTIPQASINLTCVERAVKEDTNSNLIDSNRNIIQEIKTENRLKNAPNLAISPILTQAIGDISWGKTMPATELDINEKVYVKIKDMYNKVRHVNYHTLISIGDGTRQCFVCSININKGDLSNHINECCHIENMERMKFVEKYEGDLIRQSYATYHCTLCNIVANKRDIEKHVLWLEHVQQKIGAQKSTKRQRRNDVKSGIKQYICSSQKEIMFKDAREEQIVIKLSETFNKEMPKS